MENEVTFLTLPVLDEGALIWGDLDSLGFAILDRLRAWLPRPRRS